MSKKNPPKTPQAPATPQVPDPPVPNRAHTEMKGDPPVQGERRDPSPQGAPRS